MLYRTCKRMIERGSIEGMSTKLDVFCAAGKLIDDEYKALTELLYRSFWLSLGTKKAIRTSDGFWLGMRESNSHK